VLPLPFRLKLITHWLLVFQRSAGGGVSWPMTGEVSSTYFTPWGSHADEICEPGVVPTHWSGRLDLRLPVLSAQFQLVELGWCLVHQARSPVTEADVGVDADGDAVLEADAEGNWKPGRAGGP